jgi:hypothetical protein
MGDAALILSIATGIALGMWGVIAWLWWTD